VSKIYSKLIKIIDVKYYIIHLIFILKYFNLDSLNLIFLFNHFHHMHYFFPNSFRSKPIFEKLNFDIFDFCQL